MAKDSVQRKPRTQKGQILPAASAVVPEAKTPRKTRLTGIGTYGVGQSESGRQGKADKLVIQTSHAPLGEAMLAGFAEAVGLAVSSAHAAGLAVPGRDHGASVEWRPNGELAVIEEDVTWSPEDWKSGR